MKLTPFLSSLSVLFTFISQALSSPLSGPSKPLSGPSKPLSGWYLLVTKTIITTITLSGVTATEASVTTARGSQWIDFSPSGAIYGPALEASSNPKPNEPLAPRLPFLTDTPVSWWLCEEPREPLDMIVTATQAETVVVHTITATVHHDTPKSSSSSSSSSSSPTPSPSPPPYSTTTTTAHTQPVCTYNVTATQFFTSGCAINCKDYGMDGCWYDYPVIIPCGCTRGDVNVMTTTVCAVQSPCVQCMTGWGFITISASTCSSSSGGVVSTLSTTTLPALPF